MVICYPKLKICIVKKFIVRGGIYFPTSKVTGLMSGNNPLCITKTTSCNLQPNLAKFVYLMFQIYNLAGALLVLMNPQFRSKMIGWVSSPWYLWSEPRARLNPPLSWKPLRQSLVLESTKMNIHSAWIWCIMVKIDQNLSAVASRHETFSLFVQA